MKILSCLCFFVIFVFVESTQKLNLLEKQRYKALCNDVGGVYDFTKPIPTCVSNHKITGAQFMEIQAKAKAWGIPFEITHLKREVEHDLIPVFEQSIESATKLNKIQQRIKDIKDTFALTPDANEANEKLLKIKTKIDQFNHDLIVGSHNMITPLMNLRFNKLGATTSEGLIGEANPNADSSEEEEDVKEDKFGKLKLKLEQIKEDLVQAQNAFEKTPLMNLRFHKANEDVVGDALEEPQDALSKLKLKLEHIHDGLVPPALNLRKKLHPTPDVVGDANSEEDEDKISKFKTKLDKFMIKEITKSPLFKGFDKGLMKLGDSSTDEAIVGKIYGLPKLPLDPLVPYNRAAIDLKTRVNSLINGAKHNLEVEDIRNRMRANFQQLTTLSPFWGRYFNNHFGLPPMLLATNAPKIDSEAVEELATPKDIIIQPEQSEESEEFMDDTKLGATIEQPRIMQLTTNLIETTTIRVNNKLEPIKANKLEPVKANKLFVNEAPKKLQPVVKIPLKYDSIITKKYVPTTTPVIIVQPKKFLKDDDVSESLMDENHLN